MCKSTAIKKPLEDYYSNHGTKVMIVPQKGNSSIISLSSMTVGHLLSKISSLRKKEEPDNYDQEGDDECLHDGHEKSNAIYHAAKLI